MLPGALAYTYFGFAGREAATGSEGMIRNGLLALGLLALVAFLPRLIARLRAAPMISTGELQGRLDSGENLLVLDVRGPDEYNGELGHVPVAYNVPVEELRRRLGELDGHRELPVAIVCRTDKRSAKAAEVLRRAGFSDVQVVRGGMEQWNRDGRQVAR
jgi:rhodanese-related sulfurtransferase